MAPMMQQQQQQQPQQQQQQQPVTVDNAEVLDRLDAVERKVDGMRQSVERVAKAQEELHGALQTMLMQQVTTQQQSGPLLDSLSKSVLDIDVAVKHILENMPQSN
eukprot:PhM_4_TR9048/c0_g1_i1/m.9061